MDKKPKYTSIPLRTLLHISWANIRHKKLRSSLTIAGVIVGIGAIFFLSSFGLGLQKLVANQVIGDKSIKSIEVTTSNSKIIKLDDEAVNKIKAFPHTEKTGALYSFPGNLKFQDGEASGIVYGADDNYLDMTKTDIVYGKLLGNKDSNSAMVSQATLTALGVKTPKDAIGQKLKLTVPLNNVEAKDKPITKEFVIVGIIDSGAGTEIYIPSYTFSQAGVTAYSQVKVLADNTENVNQLRKQISNIGLETTSPIDTLDQINQIFKFFNLMLVGFGAIGMIVAVLGMFNTLTISLLERTQEIGLMIALGGRSRDMRRLFILEATMLSLIGSVAGVIMAMMASWVVNLGMNKLASSRGVQAGFNLFASPLWLILSLICFMVLVGLMVVYFPARRAQKINPIDALRRE